jgi:2-phosphoglycerate kinase
VKRRDLRVEDGLQRYPFATGPIVESLQAAGVATDDAMRLARDLEKHYRQRHEREIDLTELMLRLQRLVGQQAGHEAAAALGRQTPPFTGLEVANEDGQRDAFSRRRLATSLEKLGLAFKEAHGVVRQVEQGLRADGRREVPERELYQRVASALEARFGRDVRARYEATLELAAELVVVEEGRTAGLPFSRGVLAQSLLAIGLDPELSHRLARRTEDQLWRLGASRVSQREVRDVVRRLLQDEAGEEFARRYVLLRSLRHTERPVVILVSGAAGVGKSVLAAELAYRLGIARVVSTDSVRQALRSLISPELSPILHASSYAAWRAELLPHEIATAKPKRKRVVRGFQAQVQQMNRAIEAIVDRNVKEMTSLVIEGTHLVPGLSPGNPDERAMVVELVLMVRDDEDHRENFARREGRTHRLRPSGDYLEHFTEIRMIQDFVVGQAAREGVPVIDTTDLDRAVERAVESVLNTMTAEGALAADPPTPAVVVPADEHAATPGRGP